MRGIVRDLVSVWIILGGILLLFGIAFDTAAWATTSWGSGTTDTFYTTLALWRVCNGTRTVSLRERKEIFRSDPVCVFSSKIGENWIIKAFVLEILGAVCAVGVLVTLILFLVSLRLDWIRSRFVLTASIPLSLLAAIFNLAGLLVMAVHMDALYVDPDYSLVLDSLGVVCFALGGIAAIFDMQGICMKKRPVIGRRALARPI